MKEGGAKPLSFAWEDESTAENFKFKFFPKAAEKFLTNEKDYYIIEK